MKTKIFLALLIITASVFRIFPQSDTLYKFEFLPSGMNFMPLKANFREARLGILYLTENTNLKVDIGNNIDLLGLNINGPGERLTTGIEFMAYALSTSYKGNRLQIDAIDGFFGGNLSYTKELNKLPGNREDKPDKFLVRLRIIHNSAHFVDGHYDTGTKEWIDNRPPVPYTEDFGELTLAHQLNSKQTAFKYLGGFSYSTLVRPSDLKRYNFHIGFEFALVDILGKIGDKDGGIFMASYIRTQGTEKYIVSQQTMLGIKLGDWEKKGIIFYLSYYTGRDVFGSYFNRRTSHLGIGFSVDYP